MALFVFTNIKAAAVLSFFWLEIQYTTKQSLPLNRRTEQIITAITNQPNLEEHCVTFKSKTSWNTHANISTLWPDIAITCYLQCCDYIFKTSCCIACLDPLQRVELPSCQHDLKVEAEHMLSFSSRLSSLSICIQVNIMSHSVTQPEHVWDQVEWQQNSWFNKLHYILDFTSKLI